MVLSLEDLLLIIVAYFADNLKSFPIIDSLNNSMLILNDLDSLNDWCNINNPNALKSLYY